MNVFEQIGLDLYMVIISGINFLVFFLILKKFVFDKIDKVLVERQKMVEQSIKDAQRLKEELLVAENKSREIIKDANNEANQIVDKFKKEGEQLYSEMKVKAVKEIELEEQKSLEKIEAEKDSSFREIRSKAADLVVMGTEKILKEKLNVTKDKELIEKYLNEIENEKKEK